MLQFNSAIAQRDVPLNLANYDKQVIHFGFLIGINTTDFKVKRVGQFNSLDSLFVLEAVKQSGFDLQIVSNWHINDHFDLRFLPGLAFAQRDLEYTFYHQGVEQGVTTKPIESTFLKFPVDLKFKSNRIGNYRVFVTGGFQYAIDMVSQAKVKNEDAEFVKLQRHDYGYTIGAGFDFYMSMFKFSPAIKMYQGVRNLIVDDPLIFSSSIDRLNSRIFEISFTFE
ncbi:MAG: PorT family protein [Bacteroidia bacterium]|nr:PorT family protein [Bacteroidia bacterium]